MVTVEYEESRKSINFALNLPFCTLEPLNAEFLTPLAALDSELNLLEEERIILSARNKPVKLTGKVLVGWPCLQSADMF